MIRRPLAAITVSSLLLACPAATWAQEDLALTCTAGTATLNIEIERRGNYDATDHNYADYINSQDCAADEEWEFRYVISGSFDNSDDLVLYRGNGCVEDTGTPFTEDEDCELVEEILGSVEDGSGTFVLTATALVGDGCEGDGSAVVWMALFPYDDPNNHEAYCSRSFPYDMTATDPPTIDSAAGSESGAHLSWSHSTTDDQDHEEYVVYCASSAGDTSGDDGSSDCAAADLLPTGTDYDTLSGQGFVCAEITDGTTTSTRVTGLTNGEVYAFSMATVDQAGNIGLSSSPVCATPQPVDDFFAYYLDAGGKSGFCFVATAAYDGDYDHPDVQQLRWFRDRVLRRVPGGAWLIGRYYAHGPELAAMVASRPRVRSAVHSVLAVVSDGLRFVRAPCAWGAVVLVLSFVVTGSVARRRRGRHG